MIAVAFALAIVAPPSAPSDALQCPDPATLDRYDYNGVQDRLKTDLSAALAAHGGDVGKSKEALDRVVACYQPAFDAFATRFLLPVKTTPKDLRDSLERNGSLISPAPRS